MSFVLLGDLHLAGSLSLGRIALGSALNSRVIDRMVILDFTLQQALDRDIDTIILTGDVFEDPRPAPILLSLFIGWLKQCEAYSVSVHIVTGNHCVLRTGNFYTSSLDIITEAELPLVSVHKDINTVFLGTTAITMLPFRDRKSFNVESNTEATKLLKDSLIYELASIPRTYKKIVIGHLAILGSIPVGDEIDDLMNELFCSIEMFKGYDYVWQGHIHKPQVMNKSNPYVAHIGSADISNFGETDHKKHIVVFDEEAENEVEHIIIPTRPLHKIVVSVPADINDSTAYVIQTIKEEYPELAKSIVRVEIHLSSPELLPTNRGEIEKALYSLGVSNVSSISESKKMAPIKKDAEMKTIDSKIDPTSAIKLWATSQIDQEIRPKFIEVGLEILKEHRAGGKE